MKFIIDKIDDKKRLDMVFCEKNPNFSRAHVKKMIEDGKILLDGRVVKAGQPVKAGQVVEFEKEELKPLDAKPEDIDFEIVFENDDLVVVNKPQGLVVHPCTSTRSGTLVNGLLYKIQNLSGINGVLRPGIVHRLDKNTSGLMLVAKNDFAHVNLAKQIKDKTCTRKYLALLEGNIKDDEGKIEGFLARSSSDRKKYVMGSEGRYSLSFYRVVKRYTTACLVEFTLKTGRTHQIRVHAKSIGHCVVGDDVYGHAVKGLKGQLLHSYYLKFVDPRSGKEIELQSDLPTYFKDYLASLKELKF